MNDDLLIRFIDGNTSPEETESVLKELSQDGDAAKEWIQMVQGARLVDSKPIVDIEPEEFIAKTVSVKSVGQSGRRKVIRLPLLISVITAVAASVAIIVTLVVNNMNTGIPQDLVAEESDTTTIMHNVDSIVTEGVVDIKDVAHQAIADVITPIGDKKAKEPLVPEQSIELVGHKISQESKDATASKIEVSLFEMIRPAKSPYRVRVENPEKEFVFEWKIVNMKDVHFTIADKYGEIIINERIVESHFGIVASDIVDKGELDWIVDVTFNDGARQRKTGKIELITVK